MVRTMSYEYMFVSDNFRSRKQRNKHKGKNKRNYKLKPWQLPEDQFRCKNCKQMVFYTSNMGTIHRNHCDKCLWSLHVDTKPGNRSSTCRGRMKPIGLTFKHNGWDKYGNERRGDLMIIHICTKCGIININRIAADDPYYKIAEIFNESMSMDSDLKRKISENGITLLGADDIEDINTSFYGTSYNKNIQ